MKTQFRNLVFEGGGVKGIACVGAMKVMEQRGALAEIRRVGGTSAGAINALIYALGYEIEEQHRLLASTDFKAFMDDSFGVIRDIRRLAKDFGWYKGEFFAGWIGDLIEKKLGKRDATFQDLKDAGRPELYVIGTNLSTGWAEVFSAERHPQMPLAKALRISMSIPLFFAAVRHGPRDDVYVDGGVVLNYPIKLFDRAKYLEPDEAAYAGVTTEYYSRENARFALAKPGRSPYVYNRQSLGLRLDTREEIALFRYDEPPKGKPIQKFTEYAKALIGAFMGVQENQHLHGDDWQRTLYIDTLDVGTTDFDLSDEKKEALLQSGIDCAETYFRWFEDPAEAPANRVG
jgi:NTE family protein